METTKPPKLFGSKNLFSIDRLTQKISCFQRYHYFRNPIINGGDIVEIVIRNSYARKRWTWMNGETLSLWIVSRQTFFRKFIFFSLSDAEKFADYTIPLFSKCDKSDGDIGVG